MLCERSVYECSKAASKLIPVEYSSISSSRDGVSSYVESSVETRMASSSHGMGQITETAASYESSAITGGPTVRQTKAVESKTSEASVEASVESKKAEVIYGNDDVSKPVFIKTIEGCNVERKYK